MTQDMSTGTESRCDRCNATTDVTWQCCGSCGAPLTPLETWAARESDAVDTVADFVTPEPPTLVTSGDGVATGAAAPTGARIEDSRDANADDAMSNPAAAPVRARRRWAVVAGSLVAVALIAGALFVHLDTRSQLSDTRHELQDTSRKLSEARELTADAGERLIATRGEVTTRTAERDTIQGQLDAANAELTGVRTSLTDSQGRVNAQSGQIEALKSCLNGVSLALSYVAYYDYESAVAALEAVDVSCETAYGLL